MSARGRPVYATGTGRLCPGCGAAVAACRCGAPAATPAAPRRLRARLRLETKGRGGKSVTVVDGLALDARRVAELARELKQALGTGGSAGEGEIALQGDCRARARELLAARGFDVRG